jgi:peptide/nickel transport system permease protein
VELNIWAQSIAGLLYSAFWGLSCVLLILPIALLGSGFLVKETSFSDFFNSLIDVFLALPAQLLLLILAALLGGSPLALIIAMTVTHAPEKVRHLSLQLKRAYNDPLIEAARALGFSRTHVFFKYVLAKLYLPLLMSAISIFKHFIISESLLTYLGLGSDPLSPSLGRLISEGRGYLFFDASRFLVPVFTLSLLLIVLQRVGDRFSSLFQLRGIRYL